MTKFTDCSGNEKKGTETVFTHYLSGYDGWIEIKINPKHYQEVKYLGCVNTAGDMFACYHSDGNIIIHKGKKGDEF